MSDVGVTRAESCVIACADVWREAGEVMVSPFGTIPALGARLAKRTFSPDIVLTDGEAALMVGAPPIATRPAELVREAAMPYRSVFDVVWSGRRNMMMMASQIDRTGNQNISAIGPHAKPKVQLVGVRGAPGNSVNHPTSYWVPDHTVRTFVEQVDVVSGVGYARAEAAGAGATRFHRIPRVVSNLGVFDFETPDHTMRLRSHHPGVTVDDIVAATGFTLTVPADVAETRLPTPEELELIRVVLDPGSLRDPRGEALSTDGAGAGAGAPLHPALHTELCERIGIRYPLVQTGMGWVAGPRLVAATTEAGGLGILASATMNLDELAAAIAEVRQRTSGPFGVNLRTDVADVHERIELMIETGARVASFAQAPNAALVTRCKEAGLFVVPTVGARRHAEKVAEWGVDAVIAQGGEGGGHTGTVPTTLLLPQVVDAVGDRVLVLGAGGFFNGRGLVAALSYGAAGIAMGTRFLLSAESRVPDAVKALYLGTPVTGTVVTTKVDGAPQRVVRTDLVDHLESQSWLRSLPRALHSAYRFRQETGATFGSLLREGRAMKEGNELTWAQVVMAANAPVMTKAALVEGHTDVGVLPTGQVVGVIESLPTVADIVGTIMDEADAVLRRLSAGA